MPRQRSDLYQVDFMAALFGGFVLVWLSGQGISESSQVGRQAPVFFSLSARLIYSPPNEAEASVSVLPEEAINAPCIPRDWLRQIFGSRPQPISCHGTAVELPLPSSAYDEAVLTSARQDALTHQFVRVAGIDLRLSGDKDNPTSFPAIVGRVVNNIGPAVQTVQHRTGNDHGYVDLDLQQSLIAIVPTGWTKTPQLVVHNAATFRKIIYSETARGGGSTEYQFADINRPLPYNSKEPEARRLEVLVHWDLAGQNACYRQTIQLNEKVDAESSYGLLPCASVDVGTGSR